MEENKKKCKLEMLLWNIVCFCGEDFLYGYVNVDYRGN